MDIFVIIGMLAAIAAAIYPVIQFWEWRQNRVRIRKIKKTLADSKLALDSTKKPLKIINFTHPLTAQNLGQIQELTLRPIDEVIDISTQLDEFDSFDVQIDKLIEKIGLTPEEWQEGQFLVHLPGYAQAAVAVISELHGRMGHFPTILRLRAVEGSNPREFELAEIINLQNVRDNARQKRF